MDPLATWTLTTLHQIVHLGGARERGKDGADFLYGLSSMALCNLLVLLELNARTLCKDTLARFLGNVQRLDSVKNDEWCAFLIQRLYEGHVGVADKQQSVGQQGQQSRQKGDQFAWALDTEPIAKTGEEEEEEEDWESSDSEESSILPSDDQAGACRSWYLALCNVMTL